ncbi:hypothetical protein [Nocardia abscessus]|uniref:hypothetical protein n=1 Tax=Nocardia abscessus TaxID=120957 RepID=UPI002456197F|nr:hypothetical protein [Nocardia abscessus]
MTPEVTCTTCGKPAFPDHPDNHPVTFAMAVPLPIHTGQTTSHQVAPAPETVSRENFAKAMRLLGLDPDNPGRALLTVHIEDGRITATYGQINHVAKRDPFDGIPFVYPLPDYDPQRSTSTRREDTPCE